MRCVFVPLAALTLACGPGASDSGGGDGTVEAEASGVEEESGFVEEGILRRWCLAPSLGGPPRDCRVWSVVRDD